MMFACGHTAFSRQPRRQLPPAPARFSRALRFRIENVIEHLIILLDALDGDPDLEPTLGWLPDGTTLDECEPDDEGDTLDHGEGVDHE